MTFQLILDEIKNNLKKILDDLSISNVNFSVELGEPKKLFLVAILSNPVLLGTFNKIKIIPTILIKNQKILNIIS